jgi:ribosome assembly protein YihI (activator of Der GTPase)
VLRDNLVPLQKSEMEKEVARTRAEQQRKDKKDKVEKKRRGVERQIRKDRGTETESTDEEENNDTSAGSDWDRSPFWLLSCAVPHPSRTAVGAAVAE